MKKPHLAAALSLLATACTPSVPLMKTASAGQTGCLPDAIEISNGQRAPGGYLWNASCNGKTYLCADITSGDGKKEQFSCAIAQ